MKDSNWSVRLNKETKNHILNLISMSGLSASDYFEQAIWNWETNTAPFSKSEEQIELGRSFSNISNLFDSVINQKNSIIDKLNSNIEELNKDLITKQVEVDNAYSIIAEKKEATAKLERQTTILSETVMRYQGYELSNRELEKRVIELTNTSESSIAEGERLKAQIASMRANHKNEIEQLKKQAARDLELLNEKKDLQSEKDILKIRLDYQTKLESFIQDTPGTKNKKTN